MGTSKNWKDGNNEWDSIVINVQDNYALNACVMLKSLAINVTRYTRVYVLFLKSHLSDNSMRKMEQAVEESIVKLEFLEVDKAKFEHFVLPERFTIEIFFRLAIQDYLPSNVDRALYLDVDTIINQDLKYLFDLDMEGKCIAVCGGNADINKCENFNAGVILFDLSKIRGVISLDSYKRISDQLGDKYYGDQDILCAMYEKQMRKYIPKEKYNMTYYFYANNKADIKKNNPFFSFEDVIVFHYPGPLIRPWEIEVDEMDMRIVHQKQYVNNYSEKGIFFDDFFIGMNKLWWKYARLTKDFDSIYINMMMYKNHMYAEMICSEIKAAELIKGAIRQIMGRLRNKIK